MGTVEGKADHLLEDAQEGSCSKLFSTVTGEDLIGVEFVERAVLATPLDAKFWLEVGRWNPISLALLAPLWTYYVTGSADHWWFVARCRERKFHFIAQMTASEEGRAVTTVVFRGFPEAIKGGLPHADARWWYAREWAPCQQPRSEQELGELVNSLSSVNAEYSWMFNNCQHFAEELYEWGGPATA